MQIFLWQNESKWNRIVLAGGKDMYTFHSRIRYSESDREDRLTIEGLLDYFQDCSTFQSEDLGIGVKYLRERKLAWVLNMWQIDVKRYPQMGETVEIGTFPYDFRGFLGYRNFWMTDEAGNRLAVANTIWTLLNMEKGRPAVPPQEMKDGYVVSERLDMEYLPRKIAVPENGEAKPEVMITRHHLDTNNHVNNGQYVKIALECLPEELKVKRLRAEYKKQAFLGDVMCPRVSKEDNIYTICLNDRDGKPYSVIQLS